MNTGPSKKVFEREQETDDKQFNLLIRYTNDLIDIVNEDDIVGDEKQSAMFLLSKSYRTMGDYYLNHNPKKNLNYLFYNVRPRSRQVKARDLG